MYICVRVHTREPDANAHAHTERGRRKIIAFRMRVRVYGYVEEYVLLGRLVMLLEGDWSQVLATQFVLFKPTLECNQTGSKVT